MRTTRRDFLKTGLAAGALIPLRPNLLAGAWGKPGDRILIVHQWAGGADILNVVGPMGHSVYQAARPSLAIPTSQALRLTATDPIYFHPALADFKALFDAGELAVIQGVGLANPSFSHFQAEKYWYAADPAILNVARGWLASYLDLFAGGMVLPALDLESALNPVFTGHPVPVLSSLSNFQFRTDAYTSTDKNLELQKLRQHAVEPRPGAAPALAAAAQATADAFDAVQLLQGTGAGYAPAVTWPAGNPLNATFQLLARYIIHGLPAHVYYLRTGGFDTHANEAGTLSTLLGRIGPVVRAFFDDLKAQNPAAADKVILHQWSEFSRRIGENGSAGTDHGAATVNLVFGPRVRGGLYGAYPSLDGLAAPYTSRSLAYTVDFRRVLAEILDKWLEGPSAQVLPPGSPTQHLGFLP